jgi:cysteine synthase
MPAVAVNSMLDLIGGTPLVRLRHLVEPAMADIFCKCEQFNPGGSLKDRVALSMIEAAEREGRITPGESVIIEPTSGNTGVGLALVCAAKRYRLILTMPDNMSLERRALLKAYGAELHLTPAAAVMRGAIERATELVLDNPRAFMPQQFDNPANVAAHFLTTGPETRSSTASAPGARSPAWGGSCARSAPMFGSSPWSPKRAPSCRAGRRASTASTASAPGSFPRSWIGP